MNNPIDVYKFGGASVKDAEAVRNVLHILENRPKHLLVVISAMGKMTNAFEHLLNAYHLDQSIQPHLENIQSFHEDICQKLFDAKHPIFGQIKEKISHIKALLSNEHGLCKDQLYDQIVSNGEILSTLIVQAYLADQGIQSKFISAKDFISTDSTWRAAKVDQSNTKQRIQNKILPLLQDHVIITQGFLGGNEEGQTTTLGREGSDYSGALFAVCLEAQSLTIWKDVPGILNADPKRLDKTTMFEQLTYREAAMMTFYGASVIHPKTIKPLANHNIPLLVRSFVDPDQKGTCISDRQSDQKIPSVTFKDGLALFRIYTQHLEYVNATNLLKISSVLQDQDMDIYFLEKEAFEIKLCIADCTKDPKKMDYLEKSLSSYEIEVTTDVQLVTFFDADDAFVRQILQDNVIIATQSSDNILKILM